MDRAAAYLVSEELITSIPKDTEAGRIKASILYNTATYYLDEGISAWYKRESKGLKANLTWREQFELLLKVPWIVPICAWDKGLDLPVDREIITWGSPNYLMHETGAKLTEESMGNEWRYGPLPTGIKVIGFAFSAHALSLDEEFLDFSIGNTMREHYSNACNSILEMGARHTRNVPFAGIVRSTSVPLCSIGVNRLSSMWNIQVRGGLYHQTPIREWLRLPARGAGFTMEEHVKPKFLGLWMSDEAKASQSVESIFYQISQMTNWNYMGSQISLKTETGSPIRSPIAIKMSIDTACPNAVSDTKPSKKIGNGRNSALVGMILWALPKSEGRGEDSISPGGNWHRVTSRLQDLISSDKASKALLKRLTDDKKKRSFDPVRVKYIRSLATRLREVISLDTKTKILRRIRAEVVLNNNTYWDKTSGGLIFCEHILEELSMLAAGNIDGRREKFLRHYAINPNVIASMEMSVAAPIVIECKYCNADLGSIWILNVVEEDEDRSIEGNFLDDSIGNIVSKLTNSGAVETPLSPIDLTRSIKSLIEGALNMELSKLSKMNAGDKLVKEQFITLASVVTVFVMLSKGGAPVAINMPSLEAHISKEYIDILQKLGIVPKVAMDRMMEYWKIALSKYFSDPEMMLTNTIVELLGIDMDSLLGLRYLAYLLAPLKGYITPHQKDKGTVKERLASLSPKESSLRSYLKALLSNESYIGFRGTLRISSTKRDSRMYIKSVKSQRKHLGGIVEADMALDTEAFLQSIRIICPQLLIKPEAPSNIDGVYMDPLSLAPHLFEGGDVCKRCNIDRSMKYDSAYMKKYGPAILRSWIKRRPVKTVPCAAAPRKIELTRVVEDDKLDAALFKRFGKKYKWRAIPSEKQLAVVIELGFLISAIGYHALGEALLDHTSSRGNGDDQHSKKLFVTVWNNFMEWGMRQKEDIVRSALWRIRALMAIS